MAPTPVLLPGKSHGWRSLEGCSPWGRWESDMTERLHFHFSLSCTGEGNGNPLQCSCLESPGDGGAWWAAVYGVAQKSWLKWLSSSSSSNLLFNLHMFVFSPFFSQSLNSSFIRLWSENMLDIIFNLLNSLRLVLCPRMWSISETISHILEKKLCILLCGDGMSCRYLLY